MNIVVCCIAAFLSVFITQSIQGADTPAHLPSPADVVNQLKKQEHAIHNLSIVGFQGRIFQYDEAAKEWKATQKSLAGNAWYDGGIDGRVRIDVTERVTAQENPLKPYMAVSEIQSYDGRLGYYISETFTVAGNVRQREQAKIFPHPPDLLRDDMQRFSDGTGFTLGFARSFLHVTEVENDRLGDVLGVLLSSQRPPTFGVDTVDGRQLVTFTDLLGNEYWFDPGFDYSLVAARQAATGLVGQSSAGVYLRVLELKKISSGLFFPVKGYCDFAVARGRPRLRINFTVEKAISNDPAFSETIFKPFIPRGYKVTDEVTGSSYISDGNLDQVATTLDAAADHARDSFVAIPASHSSGDEQPPLAKAPDSIRRSSGSILVVVTFTFILLCAVVVLIRWRHMGHFLWIISIVAAIIAGSDTIANADESKMTEQSDSLRSTTVQQNDGVDACYFLLRYFRRPSPISDVVRDLKAGDACEHPCSLSDLERTFQIQGLLVEEFKTESLSVALAALQGNTAVLIEQEIKQDPRKGQGYFIALTPSKGGWLITLPTSPNVQKAIGYNELDARFPHLVGIFALKDRPTEHGQHIEVVFGNHIDLGTVDGGAQPITVDIPIINSGDEPLHINDVKTSCGCLGLPVFEPIVDVKRSSHISLTLNPRALPTGSVDRRIVICAGDANSLQSIVNVHVNIRRASDPNESISLMPSVVNYGRTSPSEFADANKEVSLVFMNRDEAHVRNLTIVQQGSEHACLYFVDSSETGDRLIFKYKIRWTSVPRGEFKEYTTLIVSQSDGKPPIPFRVKLCGEALIN